MEVKRKRGRPRKETPIEQVLEEIKEKEASEFTSIIQEAKQALDAQKGWDIPIEAEIKYFDATLSYELTGYRPINNTQGLDFNPEWFTEARDTFNRTGHYTEYRRGTKAYTEFWKEQYRRCRDGMTVNNYTITGDHYFFLNFYRLENNDPDSLKEAGGSRSIIFPNFMEGQYQWFHYLSMAKKLRLNACMMKAREAGYSQIEAAIIAKNYTVSRNSTNVCCAFAQVQLDK